MDAKKKGQFLKSLALAMYASDANGWDVVEALRDAIVDAGDTALDMNDGRMHARAVTRTQQVVREAREALALAANKMMIAEDALHALDCESAVASACEVASEAF